MGSRVVWDRLTSLNLKRASFIVPAEWRGVSQSGFGNSRTTSEIRKKRPVEVGLISASRVLGLGEAVHGGHHTLRAESGVDGLNLEKAAHEKAGRDKQHQSQGCLADHQHRAKALPGRI